MLAPADIYVPLVTVTDRIGCRAEILSTNWQMSSDTPVADIHSLSFTLHLPLPTSTVGTLIYFTFTLATSLSLLESEKNEIENPLNSFFSTSQGVVLATKKAKKSNIWIYAVQIILTSKMNAIS